MLLLEIIDLVPIIITSSMAVQYYLGSKTIKLQSNFVGIYVLMIKNNKKIIKY